MAFHEIDDATLDFILQLQLEDLQALREETISADNLTAVEVYGDQIELQKVAQAKWKIAKAINKGLKQEESRPVQPPASVPRKYNCVICNEGFIYSEAFRVPCQHYYCHSCLCELVRLRLRDQTLFPPRCCSQPIPISKPRHADHISSIIGAETLSIFKEAEVEHETVDKTYCSRETAPLSSRHR